MSRRKYRFPDRQSAEDAQARDANELGILRHILERNPDSPLTLSDDSLFFRDPHGTQYRLDVFDRKFCGYILLWQTSDTGTRGAPRLCWARDDTDARREYRDIDHPTGRAIMYAIEEACARHHARIVAGQQPATHPAA